MDSSVVAASVLLGTAFFVGLRASIEMQLLYRKAKSGINPVNRPILWVLVLVCWVITLAAGWLGLLSLRTLAGFERLEWTVSLNLLISGFVLFLPAVILQKVKSVTKARADARMKDTD